MSLKISVEHEQQGQPRPYAPHTYRSRIIIEGKNSWDRLLEHQVKTIAQATVHHFIEDEADGSMESHFRPRLTICEKVSEEQRSDEPMAGACTEWLIEIQEPFND